jgi:hypothetical protein
MLRGARGELGKSRGRTGGQRFNLIISQCGMSAPSVLLCVFIIVVLSFLKALRIAMDAKTCVEIFFVAHLHDFANG